MIENKVAKKACVECRARRRKCDRSLPSCALCDRLGRTCSYKASTRPYALPQGRDSDGSETVSEKSSDASNGILSICSTGHIHNILTSQLPNALGSVVDVQTLAAKYFSTVHLWFPILSEDAFLLQLMDMYATPQAEFSLLALSVALVAWVPKSDEEELTPLYGLVKTSVALVEAAGLSGLEVVQARLLVCLFEIGHGLDAQAFVSLGGVQRAFELLCPVEDEEEEMLRLQWGIVILERFNTLLRGGGKNISRAITSPDTLPKDRNVLDQTIINSSEPLSLSTPADIKIGPFARQAQVSHILEILLLYLNNSTTHTKEESNQLIKTLTSFSFLLPEESANPWPQYCGAMGLCVSSLMTLHSSLSPHNEENLPEAVTLQYALRRVTHFAQSFNHKVDWVDPEGISPFAPLGISIAARMQWARWVESGDEETLRGAKELKKMLGFFVGRWRCVVKYGLEDLEGLMIMGADMSTHSRDISTMRTWICRRASYMKSILIL